MTTVTPGARVWDQESLAAWLSNFNAGDVQYARVLIDSLHLISEGHFYSSMRELVDEARDRATGPIALFAVQSAPPGRFKSPKRLKALQDGSELVVQNVLNRYAETPGLLVSPKLKEMRVARVREIALFTDNVGSGREVGRFIDFLHTNRTIASWHSGGFIRFSVNAFAVSSKGHAALARHRRRPKIYWKRSGLDMHAAGWDASTELEVRRVCREYADRPKWALGFDCAESLVVFEHTTPNGLPRVMLQNRGPKGSSWAPLVRGGRKLGLRTVKWGEGQIAPPSFDATNYLDSLAEGGKARRLAAYERAALRMTTTNLEPLLVRMLVGLRTGPKDDVTTAQVANASSERVSTLLDVAFSLGYIDQNRDLTLRGRLHILGLARQSRRIERQVRRRDHQAGKIYYPQQLR